MSKRYLIIRTGQSVEADGNLVSLAGAAVYAPSRIVMPYRGRSIFGYMIQGLEDAGYNFNCPSLAVGSTGWVTHWAGTALGFGATGWDPNGYVANVVSMCTRTKTLYDQIYIIMQNGQQDSVEDQTTTTYAAAMAAIINRYLSATPAKIVLGLSTARTDDSGTAVNYAAFETAIDQLIASYAPGGRVLRGINCYRVAGLLAASLGTDQIHAAEAAGRASGGAYTSLFKTELGPPNLLT